MFGFLNFENGVIKSTLALRQTYSLPSNYLALAIYDDPGPILMKITASGNAEVIMCSYGDFLNICDGKSYEEDPTIFPTFADFYSFLLDETDTLSALYGNQKMVQDAIKVTRGIGTLGTAIMEVMPRSGPRLLGSTTIEMIPEIGTLCAAGEGIGTLGTATMGVTSGSVALAEGIATFGAVNVAAVFINQGINKITGKQGKTNFRPDAVVVKTDGKLELYEIESKTDNTEDLKERTAQTSEKLKDWKIGKTEVMDVKEAIERLNDGSL